MWRLSQQLAKPDLNTDDKSKEMAERFEEHLQTVMSFRKMATLSNYKMCEKISNMCRRVSPEKHGIDDFFEKLRQDLYW